MALITSFLLLAVALLVGGSTVVPWQPCVPYSPHEVRSDFSSLLPTSFTVRPQGQHWSLDFTLKAPDLEWRLSFRPHHAAKDKVIVSLGGEAPATSVWPAEAFLHLDIWTKIFLNFTTDQILQVSAHHRDQVYSISSGVRQVCGQVVVQVLQVIKAQLVWLCSQHCIGEQVTPNTPVKHLQGRSHTFFILPQENFQLTIAQVIQDCQYKEQVEEATNYTENDFHLNTGVWNTVFIQYSAREHHGGYVLSINGHPVKSHDSERKMHTCEGEKFIKFQLKTKRISLWAFNCDDKQYSCDQYLTTNHKSMCSPTTSHSSVTINSVWLVTLLVGVMVTVVLSILALFLTIRIIQW
ncbi:hypothetical protein Hamer_G019269 [Homarus americanus]|uniref:Uncharacterized protein n=1 Tax=Homarus americanus TaxID=6706 RepID=A0A8J5JGL9_HOMAM|nr:hypothetical protein Hamer_G019269 [Homarus americanus]